MRKQRWSSWPRCLCCNMRLWRLYGYCRTTLTYCVSIRKDRTGSSPLSKNRFYYYLSILAISFPTNNYLQIIDYVT